MMSRIAEALFSDFFGNESFVCFPFWQLEHIEWTSGISVTCEDAPESSLSRDLFRMVNAFLRFFSSASSSADSFVFAAYEAGET
ncbi:hypothetical protein R1flu_026970 [Riccia fluitans]|uniref:Uncharacterized protein n=1 Tax=Riccia fluitans TaxID=41844 RepID=A0ABD1XHG8_9MARC